MDIVWSVLKLLVMIALVVALVVGVSAWLGEASVESYAMYKESIAPKSVNYGGQRAPMATPADALKVFLVPVFADQWALLVSVLGGAVVLPFVAWLTFRMIKGVMS